MKETPELKEKVEQKTKPKVQGQFSFGPQGLNLRSGNKHIQQFIDNHPLGAAFLALPAIAIIVIAAMLFAGVVVLLTGIFVVIVVPLGIVFLPIAKLLGMDVTLSRSGAFFGKKDVSPKRGIIVCEDSDFDIDICRPYEHFRRNLTELHSQKSIKVNIENEKVSNQMTEILLKESPAQSQPQEQSYFKLDRSGLHSSNPKTQQFIDEHPILATAAAIPVGAAIAVGAAAVAGAAIVASPVIYALGGPVEFKNGVKIGGPRDKSESK
ncbi:hypothetical protein HDV06_001289 [Boothiomyces sp. JEL0866]|nr:hypothetical protein HDV06_001289 [Boothiomyces sp. JEL0866]